MTSFIKSKGDVIYVANKVLEYSSAISLEVEKQKELRRIVKRGCEDLTKKDRRYCQTVFEDYFPVAESSHIRKLIIDSNRKHRQSRAGVNSKQKSTKLIRISEQTYERLLTKIKKRKKEESLDDVIMLLLNRPT